MSFPDPKTTFDEKQRRIVTSIGPAKVSVPAEPKTAAEPNIRVDLKPAKTEPKTQRDEIVAILLDSPLAIADAQMAFDAADRAYKARLAQLTIDAFSKPLFPGKKPEDGLRPASNDTEREAAIETVVVTLAIAYTKNTLLVCNDFTSKVLPSQEGEYNV